MVLCMPWELGQAIPDKLRTTDAMQLGPSVRMSICVPDLLGLRYSVLPKTRHLN